MDNGGWVLKFWAAAAVLSEFRTVFGKVSGIWAGAQRVSIATGGGFRYTAVRQTEIKHRTDFCPLLFSGAYGIIFITTTEKAGADG